MYKRCKKKNLSFDSETNNISTCINEQNLSLFGIVLKKKVFVRTKSEIEFFFFFKKKKILIFKPFRKHIFKLF
jgi:hypothetical protein